MSVFVLAASLGAAADRSRVAMRAEPVDAVFAWARPTACAVRVGVDPATGVRGLVMARAAALGEVILEVPTDSVLADADASAPPLAGTCGPWASGLPPHTQLALVLIREARLGSRSAWAPYLASLPPSCLPKDMEASALRQAQDTAFEIEAESSYCAVHEALDAALDAIAGGSTGAQGGGWEGDLPTAVEFQAAMSLVWTRCLRLDLGPGAGTRRLLVPCVDMANHEARPSAFFASAHGAGAAAVRLHAARALGAGEAVTLSYGEGSGEHWAQHYGFVPAEQGGAARANPYDCVAIRAAELAPEAAALARRGGSEDAGALWAAHEGRSWQLRATGVDVSLFAALRQQLAVASGAGSASTEGDGADEEEALAERPLPPADEASVADAIAAACARKLRALPTSAEEDGALLAAMAPGEPARLLVQLRRSRKALLGDVAERMRAYAAAQREAAGDAERGRQLWKRLVGEAGELSAFPELDALGVDALQQLTLSSSSGPAMMFALVAGS